MSKILILSITLMCYFASVSCSEYLHHDYDIQIHPTHDHHGYGDHGYGDHGFATSIRYDTRHQIHKIPEYGHDDDLVYQYVSDGHHHELDEHLY